MKLSKRLIGPCKYIVLRVFKLKFRKRLFVKFQRRKQQRPQQQQHQPDDRDSRKLSTRKSVSFRSVLQFLRFRRKTKTSDVVQMDRMMELKSLSPAAVENQDTSCVRTKNKISASTNYVTAGSENREKYSCLRTTGRTAASAYVSRGVRRRECSEEVEEACRSFENYLAEMIVEEGRTKDLMDVEQLLYCWDNLRCPVFIDLVSRFYGELCKDLFSDK